MKTLKTNHGTITFPAFFPDATRGVVRTVDTKDLENADVAGLVVNTYHLFNHDMADRLEHNGGVHALMGWNKPIISDSGGYQVLSLARKDPRFGKVREDDVVFRDEKGKRVVLTPEKSIHIQIQLGSDIVICLDDCTSPDEPYEVQEKAVERTVRWAARCREAFNELTKDRENPPYLFCVTQGGHYKELRKLCAEGLLAIGFDGYGYGGFPVNKDKELLSEVIKYTAELLPDDKPKYAMGLGTPRHLVDCFNLGYDLFDCVIPTRDGRHGRLFIYKDTIDELDILKDDFYEHFYIKREHRLDDHGPISSVCDCYTCTHFTRRYLAHLFRIGDSLAMRLATIHNLRFYSMLMEKLKATL